MRATPVLDINLILDRFARAGQLTSHASFSCESVLQHGRLNLRGEMIRKLKVRPVSALFAQDHQEGKRRNLGTFKTRAAAEKHERAVQFFKRADKAARNSLQPIAGSSELKYPPPDGCGLRLAGQNGLYRPNSRPMFVSPNAART